MIQTDSEIAKINISLIPDSIRRGIAPAMHHAHSCTFWGTPQPTSDKANGEQAYLLGCRPPPKDDFHARGIQEKTEGHKVNARQLISTLRGGHGQGETPDYPEDVQGSPPVKPMGYTDGGVKNPHSHLLQMAGFGLWWPNPPEVGEDDQITRYTYQRQAEQGVLMWGNMSGQESHSTRTELAAVLIAMLRPIPLHIASDSQAMIDKANMLIDAAILWQLRTSTDDWTTANPCGRPWGLQKDGDLWERFWAASLLRGPRTLKLTKVKGHTTTKDVQSGIITAENREGNRHADIAATLGTEEGMPGLPGPGELDVRQAQGLLQIYDQDPQGDHRWTASRKEVAGRSREERKRDQRYRKETP